MALERRPIVLALIAEHATKLIEPGRIADQKIPIVVPDLVAEMAEQGAIGLLHRVALTLALGIVRFRQAERDEPAGVAGHHRL